jgi:spermidine synthase
VALFGIGASGVGLSLAGPRFDPSRWRAIAAALFAITALVAYAGTNAIPFAPFRILQDPRQLVYFLLYDVVVMLPFFFSGAVVAMLLRAYPLRAGKLYAFDLVGAALGTLLVFVVLPLGGARGAVAMSVLLGLVSALLLAPTARLRATIGIGLAAALLLVVRPSLLPDVRMDASKPLRQEIERGGKHAFSRWNALSRIDVVEQPDADPMILIDAAAATPITAPRDSSTAAELSTVAYQLRPQAAVAVIGSGGGVDVQNALALKARSVTAIEINPIIIGLVTDAYDAHVGGAFRDPRVRLVRDEGRSFIARSGAAFDVIQITLIDTWAASVSGAYSLSENYLYTREAVAEYIDHLSPDGFLSITRWYYESPRLVVLVRAGLEAAGIADASRHVLVVQDGIRALVLVKKTPFTPAELDLVRARRSWTIHHDPTAPGDPNWAQLLTAPDPQAAFPGSDISLQPVSDDSPFFFQMTRWRSLRLDNLRKFGGQGVLEPLAIPVAQIALVSALGLALLLSGLLLSVPLLKRSVPRAGRMTWLTYFLCLGVAFIVVEVVLMQRFALFLGHPTYSVTAVLFAILLFSGLGAAWLDRRQGSPAQIARPVRIGLPLAILVLAFAVPPILRELIGLPHALRLVIALAVIGPVAFLMGVPFPLGIRTIAATASRSGRETRAVEGQIAWAWAANGCASVVGSVCAVLGAMVWNFSTMLVLAGVVYAGALWLLSRASSRGLP